MKDTTFKQDLQIGKEAEVEFIQRMEQTNRGYTDFQLNESDDLQQLRKYDVSFKNAQGKELKQEVKCDVRSSETGNFQIEVMYKGNISGILTTEAELFVIKSQDSFYIFRTATLRQLLQINRWKQITINNGTQDVILVPMSQVINHAALIL